ncbi:MAG: hypothetical protein ABSF43_05335 [Rectinemataceae bacterium]
MARMNKNLGTVIIIVLLIVLLYALNPTTPDFQAWRSAQAERGASSGTMTGLIGTLKSGAGKIAGAMTGGIAGLYSRKDYLVCSIYSMGRDRYLGIAHLFIKLM